MRRRRPRLRVIVLCICIIIAVCVVLSVSGIVSSDKNSFITMTDALLTQQEGNFRYVFDVRTDKHNSKKAEDDTVIAPSAIPTGVTEGTEKDFVPWTNESGVENVDWRYPKYKVIIEGDIASANPINANINISLATSYFNDKLTNILIKDGKTYINIEQLRYWLMNSKDENLVNLGSSLPQSTTYVEYSAGEFSYYSPFAEDSEVESSRDANILNIYNRFLCIIKYIASNVTIGDKCLTKGSSSYNIDISGDNSTAFLNSLKYLVLDIGGTHNAISNMQKNYGFITDTQYSQRGREVDNLVSAFSGQNVFLSTTDLSTLNFKVSGSAKKYIGGKGTEISESVCSCTFTANNTDYNIDIQLYKDAQVNEINVSKQSSTDISSFKDKDFIEKYFLNVLEYLNVAGVDLEKKLEITPSNIKSNAVSDFVTLVNSVNKNNKDFTPVTSFNVINFINSYRNASVDSQGTNEDKVNATLVSDFLHEFDDLKSSDTSQELDKKIKDRDKFISVVYENENIRLYADFDRENSNVKCVCVQCYILNKTNSPINVKLTDFSLRTLLSSKFPANYADALREYDSNFDFSKALETVDIDAKSFIKVPMYFVVSDIEYMDLWLGELKLGALIAY